MVTELRRTKATHYPGQRNVGLEPPESSGSSSQVVGHAPRMSDSIGSAGDKEVGNGLPHRHEGWALSPSGSYFYWDGVRWTFRVQPGSRDVLATDVAPRGEYRFSDGFSSHWDGKAWQESGQLASRPQDTRTSPSFPGSVTRPPDTSPWFRRVPNIAWIGAGVTVLVVGFLCVVLVLGSLSGGPSVVSGPGGGPPNGTSYWQSVEARDIFAGMQRQGDRLAEVKAGKGMWNCFFGEIEGDRFTYWSIDEYTILDQSSSFAQVAATSSPETGYFDMRDDVMMDAVASGEMRAMKPISVSTGASTTFGTEDGEFEITLGNALALCASGAQVS